MRNYERKTESGSTPVDIMERAAEAVKTGGKMKSVARDFDINVMTLKRFIFVPESRVYLFPKKDIVRKLPMPKSLGGSARRSCQLQFSCDLQKWGLK